MREAKTSYERREIEGETSFPAREGARDANENWHFNRREERGRGRSILTIETKPSM